MKKKFGSVGMCMLLTLTLMCSAAPLALADTTWQQLNEIIIYSPCAGDSYFSGSAIDISWKASDASSVNLYYSTDGGSTWDVIATDVANSGGAEHYNWTAPSTESTHYKIRVSVFVDVVLPMLNDIMWYNDSGEFSVSQFHLVIPVTPLLTIPAAPGNLDLDSVTAISSRISWTDNSSNESEFVIERKAGDGFYAEIDTVTANITSYSDSGLSPLTTYRYRVKAVNSLGSSEYSNVLVVDTPALVLLLPPPAAPSDLEMDSITSTTAKISWKDNSSNETGFVVERKNGSGSFSEIDTVTTDTISYTDTDLSAETTYSYRIKAVNLMGSSAYSNVLTVNTPEATAPPAAADITMKFYINSTDYYVNGAIQTMDAAPVIIENRTVLPIRYVADALGASVAWDPVERKVTITGTNTIEMWIDNPQARVNGMLTFIDPSNANVKPVILPPGRTMIPLRFIAENLGCSVGWDQAIQEVTLQYPD